MPFFFLLSGDRLLYCGEYVLWVVCFCLWEGVYGLILIELVHNWGNGRGNSFFTNHSILEDKLMSRFMQRWTVALAIAVVLAGARTAAGATYAVDTTLSYLDITSAGLTAQQTGSDRIRFTGASGLDATVDTGLETITINSGNFVAALFGSPTALAPAAGGGSGTANANAGLKDATFGTAFLAAAIRGFEGDFDSGAMSYNPLDGSFSAASVSFFSFLGNLDYRVFGGLVSGSEDLSGLDPVSNDVSAVGQIIDADSFFFEVLGVAEIDDPSIGTFEINLTGRIYANLVGDDLQLQEVPEPGTLVLLSFGAVLIPVAALRARRRNAARK